jgi:hypothetical protein
MVPSGCDMLTLFTWGYWGWGNATRELIRAVDATERDRGFKPPVFFDIRTSRSVRAKGFRDDAFERLLPKGRYRWFPRLGNARIKTHEHGIKIADPFAAKILLEEAVGYARDNRRILFFCACERPRFCHRHIVARLVLEEANRIGRRVRIVEWPGGAVSRKTVKVTDSIFDGVVHGVRTYVPVDDRSLPLDQVFLPWGSILDVESHGKIFPVLTGPAKFRGRWELPVHGRWELPDSHPYEYRVGTSRLRADSEDFRKRWGFGPLENDHPGPRVHAPPKALTIRQPWAHAVVHLGKDVENRSWRANYRGPVLIHASAHPVSNPHVLLAEHMAHPPSQAVLDRLPTGCVVGVADLLDYVRDSESKWAIKGQWHWLLRNVRPIRPVPCTGRLGLWTPSAALMLKMPAWVRAY